MTKFTKIQREELRQCVIDGTIRRLSLAELKQSIEHKMAGVNISIEYLQHLRADIKKNTKAELNLLRKDRYAYLDELIFDPVRALKLVLKNLLNVI